MDAFTEMDETVEVRSLELPMVIVDVTLEAFTIGEINVTGKLCPTVIDVAEVAGDEVTEVFERLEVSERFVLVEVVAFDKIPETPLVEEIVRLFEELVALPISVVLVKFEDAGVVNQTLEFSPEIEETCVDETVTIETETFMLIGGLDCLLLVTS